MKIYDCEEVYEPTLRSALCAVILQIITTHWVRLHSGPVPSLNPFIG